MFSEANLCHMKKIGIEYIVAAKLRSMDKTMKNAILTDSDFRATVVGEDLCWAKEYSYKEKIEINFEKKREEDLWDEHSSKKFYRKVSPLWTSLELKQASKRDLLSCRPRTSFRNLSNRKVSPYNSWLSA